VSTGPLGPARQALRKSPLAVNVWGAATVTEFALGPQTATASVVNIASVHAVATSAGLGVDAASKGAMVALTRALAIELAPDGMGQLCPPWRR
jgi:NAD(P)-dependent dehydrogenase (short-subunit alcohol dehydrogenase family)